MKRLLYISPLPKDSQTGGANAVNYHTFNALQRHFDCHYVQINPPEPRWGRWVSQLKRKLLKQPGRFNFFSGPRLRQVAREFEAIKGDFDYVFFRGFTPWVLCKPKVPFIAYNDVHFLQFFKNTFNEQDFIKYDIERICKQEQQWLSKARAIAFESAWGATKCLEDYQTTGPLQMAVGRGGHIPLPAKDHYEGGFDLVIIANHFYQKGGDLVFKALQQLHGEYPELQLHIIGGDPGTDVKSHPAVVYHGYLFKERPEDLKQLSDILSKAFLLMHITREDTNPLVVTEAGYFGCPTISVERFALPELVLHNKTGVLLPYVPTPDDIANAIVKLIQSPDIYLEMRQATWEFNRTEYSWERIGVQLKNMIEQTSP